MYSKKNIIIAISLIMLSGCAKNGINSVSDIRVDEDRNVVFMGYDFTIPDPRIRHISVKCRRSDAKWYERSDSCLSIAGNTRNLGNFTFKGAKARRLKFGEYYISHLEYSIKTGTKTTRDSKGNSFTTDVISKVVIALDVKANFTVSKEISPYIGRFHIDIDHENIEAYFKKRKKGDIKYLSKFLKLKISQKYSEDILNSKYSSALNSHINSPNDRRNVNDEYKNNIKCTGNVKKITIHGNCKLSSTKELPKGVLLREYPFSFSVKKYQL